MQQHDAEKQEQELTPGMPESNRQDDTDNTESAGNKAHGVDELPDGSGTDTQGSAGGHGQESGLETFDAG